MFDITDKIKIGKKVYKFTKCLFFEIFKLLFQYLVSKSLYRENILTLKIVHLAYSKQKYIQNKKKKKEAKNNKSPCSHLELFFGTILSETL